MTKLPLPEKLVVLTFDDAVSNHATLAGPLLREYGFGATFFVCEFPPDFATNQQQYMTWPQIAELARAGFEIGNHTLTHAGVCGLNDGQLRMEIAALNRRCAEYAIPEAVTFAYPGGGVCEAAVETLRRLPFRYARIVGNRAYDPQADDPLLVPSFALQGDDPEPFYRALAAGGGGKIPVLVFHGIPEYTHPWVNTPPERFREYMDYLAEKRYTVIALRDLSRFF